MRRTILLGLGPLISLWALSTQAVAAERVSPLSSEQRAAFRTAVDSLDRLLHPVVSLLILAAEQESAGSAIRTAPHSAILGLEALKNTTYHGSLWLVRGMVPGRGYLETRTLQTLLRC